MEMKTKILDKKHMIIISIAIISIIIGVINATYAYFSDRQDKEIIFGSASNFGGGALQKTDVVLNGDVTKEKRLTNANDENNVLSIKFDDVSEQKYLVSLIAEVDPNESSFDVDDISNVTNSNIKFEVYHKTNKDLDTSSFSCENHEYSNGGSTDFCGESYFISKLLDGYAFEMFDKYEIADTEEHYFDVYISNSFDETLKLKINFYFLIKESYKPHFNEPDLSSGLIPVVYDANNKTETGTGWFVADTSTAWYNYESQWWANAVSVDSTTEGIRSKYVNTDGTYNAGTEIATSDMLAMFVWIPRFSYTIGCHKTSSCYGYRMNDESDKDSGDPSQTLPGAIDIKFVSTSVKEDPGLEFKEYPTYEYEVDEYGYPTSSRKPNNWYTHPSFTFGDKELSGIWVGKFETSVNQSSTCYTTNLIPMSTSSASSNCQASKEDVTPRILPNVLSLVYQNVYNEFEIAKKFTSADPNLKCGDVLCNVYYGLTNKTDSHMMKNSEWGAVAYLSQSVYGKYGNANYEGTNKEIYINDSGESNWARYTGRSQGLVPATSSYSLQGSYKYNDIEIIKNEDNTYSDGEKVANSGTGASTTGNIYGIYDMNGGAVENVMGNYNNRVENSGFTFTTDNVKYYDKFAIKTPFATKSKETVGQALYEVASWYGDSVDIFNISIFSHESSQTWLSRGGHYDDGSSAGAFFGFTNGGGSDSSRSFRSVLVMTGA